MNLNPNLPFLLTMITILLSGCSDDRAVSISREAANRQAAQNVEMAQLNREVTTAHRDLTELQQDVQAERSELNSGWNDLEAERQDIARDRRTESLLAALVPVAGTVVVIVSALYLASMLLRHAQAEETVERELCELLVTELASDQPTLLPKPVVPRTPLPIGQDLGRLESHSDETDSHS